MIAFCAFVILLVLLALLAKKSVLARVTLLPGEEILMELEGLRLRVLSSADGRETLVFRAFVRVTDRRVIVGTGSPRKPRTALVRYVVELERESFGRGPLEDGFVTFPAQRGEITVDGRAVRIQPVAGSAAFEIPHCVVLECAEKDAESLRAAMVERALPPVEGGGYRR
jgi:hypothetical protein